MTVVVIIPLASALWQAAGREAVGNRCPSTPQTGPTADFDQFIKPDKLKGSIQARGRTLAHVDLSSDVSWKAGLWKVEVGHWSLVFGDGRYHLGPRHAGQPRE